MDAVTLQSYALLIAATLNAGTVLGLAALGLLPGLGAGLASLGPAICTALSSTCAATRYVFLLYSTPSSVSCGRPSLTA